MSNANEVFKELAIAVGLTHVLINLYWNTDRRYWQSSCAISGLPVKVH